MIYISRWEQLYQHPILLSFSKLVDCQCAVNGCAVNGCAVNDCAVNGCAVNECAAFLSILGFVCF